MATRIVIEDKAQIRSSVELRRFGPDLLHAMHSDFV
jgi:hypothetical protein